MSDDAESQWRFLLAAARAMRGKCPYCQIPTALHFAWCVESGFKGNVPGGALTPNAISFDIRELPWCKPAPTKPKQ